MKPNSRHEIVSSTLSEEYRKLFEVAGLVYSHLGTLSKVEALKLMFPVDVRESATPQDPDAIIERVKERAHVEAIAVKDAVLQELRHQRAKRNRGPSEKTTQLAKIIRNLRLHHREHGRQMTWSRVTRVIRESYAKLLTPEQIADFHYAKKSFERIHREDNRRRDANLPQVTRRKPAAPTSG